MVKDSVVYHGDFRKALSSVIYQMIELQRVCKEAPKDDWRADGMFFVFEAALSEFETTGRNTYEDPLPTQSWQKLSQRDYDGYPWPKHLPAYLNSGE